MYSTVPTTEPTIVCAAVAARTAPAGNVPAAPPAGGPEVDRAMPKSITRPSPSASTMMLAGLRSRCTTPARWAAPSPDATLRAMIITRGTASLPSRLRMVARSSPSRNGIVMYLRPSTSPMSWTRTMFLCVTLRASSSSCLNRCSSIRAVSGSAATSGRTVFSATATPSSASQAWYTAPMPPAPSSLMM